MNVINKYEMKNNVMKLDELYANYFDENEVSNEYKMNVINIIDGLKIIIKKEQLKEAEKSYLYNGYMTLVKRVMNGDNMEMDISNYKNEFVA